jgi:hypothetical protein
MAAGRPKRVNPSALYMVAHDLYRDFRLLAEGKKRFWFDEREYERLKAEPITEPARFSPQERALLEARVEEEVRTGHFKAVDKAKRLRDLECEESRGIRDYFAKEEAVKEKRFPGEPEVLKVLLDPDTTPEQIRELCKDAFMTRMVTVGTEMHEAEVPAWPIVHGSVLPGYLSQHAEEFVAAKRDPRFPGCDVSRRPTNQLKQLWFLSRALAGAVFGVKTRTAINLVGSTRPELLFEYSRAAKPKRKPSKQRKRNSMS